MTRYLNTTPTLWSNSLTVMFVTEYAFKPTENTSVFVIVSVYLLFAKRVVCRRRSGMVVWVVREFVRTSRCPHDCGPSKLAALHLVVVQKNTLVECVFGRLRSFLAGG